MSVETFLTATVSTKPDVITVKRGFRVVEGGMRGDKISCLSFVEAGNILHQQFSRTALAKLDRESEMIKLIADGLSDTFVHAQQPR
jgi:hypothetical protein